MKRFLTIIGLMAVFFIFFYTVNTFFFLSDSRINKNISIQKIASHGDGNEPPKNSYLADSPWPMSHRNPYCQASSPWPGPTAADKTYKGYLPGLPGAITISFRSYSGGNTVYAWAANQRSVYKIKFDPAKRKYVYIDSVVKKNFNWSDLLNPDVGISGAYTLTDREGTFFLPRFRRIYAYEDSEQGNPGSRIKMRGYYEIPKKMVTGSNEIINGMNMTYDGKLAFVTNRGLLVLLSRDFKEAHYLHFGPGEEISNSIACDEKGGIYVVTSKRMYCAAWTGKKLSFKEADGGWSALYKTGGEISGVRLGKGSGATPTLMGVRGQDKFVVITDGQKLMHIVLFWRDKIPAGWKILPGTLDRRIAAEVPVTFGNKNAKRTLSEQSVCVRGYGALVVNNQMNLQYSSKFWSIFRSGDPYIAPYGAEKFEWDPRARKLQSVWVNRTVSLPSGIPSMSTATGLIYDIGQRNGTWTFEAISWKTGESVFHHDLGPIPPYNSVWAATEIGPLGILVSGALSGMMSLK